MQIIGPDGTPIESASQLPRNPSGSSGPSPAPPPGLRPPSTPGLSSGYAPGSAEDASAKHAVPIATRAPSTTIDALEREFQRKKQLELSHARNAGASAATNGNSPRVTGEKVGRNDPCPCGSGKKYKKCHGTNV
jgi:preprotein translocase subunit SecA